MDNIYYMSEAKLDEIISKFEMPSDRYSIINEKQLGESEDVFIVKNTETGQKFLIARTYFHPSIEQEMKFYQDNNLDVVEPVIRKLETLDFPEDANHPNRKYLFQDYYSIFKLK